MLIHNKDDIELVTEFPCLLRHPVDGSVNPCFSSSKQCQLLFTTDLTRNLSWDDEFDGQIDDTAVAISIGNELLPKHVVEI